MSTGTVSFYQFKGGLSSGEYPLVTGSETATHTISNVKYQKGLQTTLDVTTFTGFDTVNVAKIDGNYYWITSFRERTNANGQVHYTLDFMAPTSLLRVNDSITGVWRRTPTRKCGYLRDEITNDVMEIYDSTANIGSILSYLYYGDIRYIYFWQVTGYDANNNLKRFGGFFEFDPDYLRTRYVWGAPNGGAYPTFEDLFKNMSACVGILPENVIDFSISVRQPYDVGTTTDQGTTLYQIKDVNSNLVVPTVNGSDPNLYSYDLTALWPNTELKAISTNTTFTTTASAREIGRLSLIDWNANRIMDIPTGLMTGSNAITISTQTVCDVSGIYTIFKCGDMQITVPEGRLPYNSNTWETYKAYQMNTDRQSLENSIRFAQFNRETQSQTALFKAVSSGVQSGIMTGIMANNPAGALAGLPMALFDYIGSEMESDRALRLANMQAEADYQLSQRRAIDQPQTSYNAGYGLIYCILNSLRPVKLALTMPKNVSSTYITNWHAQYGYPAEGVITLTVTTGFYQGKLTGNATGSIRGMYYDELNKTFENGFKFVSPT